VQMNRTNTDKYTALLQKARQYLPGGVSAAARVGQGIGGPFFVSRGAGSKIYDLDGREYIDLHTSFGASLLGHGHPRIKEAVARGLDMGILCSHETEYQAEAARRLVQVLPCADMVRFSGSGTETTYYAIKLAREYTGKDKIIKFEGHFHGLHDYLQYNCWPPSGKGWPKVYPEGAGVPKGAAKHVIVLPFNDLAVLEETIQREKDDVAAVILEPINYNSGGILPQRGYLEALRELTTRHGILLIFDEILSGFRTGPGCAQDYLGVTPDLCTVGKAIGGGMPISAFGGRGEIMEHVGPLGKAQHSGTYNAPLVCIMAVNAFLEEISQPAFYDQLLARSLQLYDGIRDIIQCSGVPCWLQATGARFNLLFGIGEEPRNYTMAAKQDVQMRNRFAAAALRNGVFFYPSWHHGISAAHTETDIERALAGIEAAMRQLRLDGAGTRVRHEA